MVLPGDRAALPAPGLDKFLEGRVAELPRERENLSEAAVAGWRDAGAADEREVQEDGVACRWCPWSSGLQWAEISACSLYVHTANIFAPAVNPRVQVPKISLTIRRLRRRSDVIPSGSQRNGLLGDRMRNYMAPLLAAGVLLLTATQYASAQEGPYVSVAAGWNRTNAEYTKGIGLDVPPASYEVATSDAEDGVGTVRASLGYRTFVTGRLYVSGELEAALHGGSGPTGYLREGTGVGDRDVWPGPWSVQRKRGLGMNARLGYAPGGLLGEGGSVYVVTGVHWERATLRRGSDIGGEAIRTVADRTLHPWVVGVGVEWGSLASRVGLEVRYSAAELEFRTGGDGSALGMPRIDHRFGVREVGIQVGYVRSF